nr:sodium:proton antiporter NhaD [Chitinophagaceae bacterium]
ILFFLIGAMTIVELIDIYSGFEIILAKITTTRKQVLLVIVTFISFFLSAVLDNLTTAIIMSSLVVKILPDSKDRRWLIAMIVIAANAGGAWSPIGDVTTTMLWVSHQITALGIMKALFLPSLVAALIPMGLILFRLQGQFIPRAFEAKGRNYPKEQTLILGLGMSLLVGVPIFKTVTHLPPFMGMMLAVGILWAVSETLHKRHPSVNDKPSAIFSALEKIDMPSILFFLGILLAVGALSQAGVLTHFATWLTSIFPDPRLLLGSIGMLSAIFDNVPLVAAVQGMFHIDQYPEGSFFWNFLAYCSGTGGSLLIIGSAAGVAAMGIEKIDFFWYLKHISWIAGVGYLVGALVACL